MIWEFMDNKTLYNLFRVLAFVAALLVPTFGFLAIKFKDRLSSESSDQARQERIAIADTVTNPSEATQLVVEAHGKRLLDIQSRVASASKASDIIVEVNKAREISNEKLSATEVLSAENKLKLQKIAVPLRDMMLREFKKTQADFETQGFKNLIEKQTQATEIKKPLIYSLVEGNKIIMLGNINYYTHTASIDMFASSIGGSVGVDLDGNVQFSDVLTISSTRKYNFSDDQDAEDMVTEIKRIVTAHFKRHYEIYVYEKEKLKK